MQTIMEDFPVKCTDITNASIKYYDENAGHYQKTVFSKVRTEVVSIVHNQLLECFDNQLRKNKSEIQERFLRKLKGFGARRDVANDQFHAKSSALFDEATKAFIKKSAELLVEGAGWGDRIEQHQYELENYLKEQIQNEREKEVTKFYNLTLKATQDVVDDIIN